MRIECQPAYLLHARDYRDSSLLLELLSVDYGRVSAVVKGVKASTQSSRYRRSLLQPFVPLIVSWSGKGELKSLQRFESRGMAQSLVGTRLFSGLYLNEILLRLLPHTDSQPELFALYEWAIKSLAGTGPIDTILRQFELSLLNLMGYGVDFTRETETHQQVDAQASYRFIPEHGVVRVAGQMQGADIFSGQQLMSIAEGGNDDATRHAAKRLCRLALKPHIGDKPLKSRELFRSQ